MYKLGEKNQNLIIKILPTAQKPAISCLKESYSKSSLCLLCSELFSFNMPLLAAYSLVITATLSLCNRYLLCFRHIVSEYNWVSWDILIKMLISWTMWKSKISCKLNHKKLLLVTDEHELVNPFLLCLKRNCDLFNCISYDISRSNGKTMNM